MANTTFTPIRAFPNVLMKCSELSSRARPNAFSTLLFAPSWKCSGDPACLIVTDPLIAAKRNLRRAPNSPKNQTGQAQFMQDVKETGRTRRTGKGRKERK